MDQYQKFLERSTHQQVQDYLSSIGFNSAGALIYSQNLNDTVTHHEAIDYVMDENYLFQVQGVIMRPIGKANNCSVTYRFLLTMTSSNLNSTSYNDLANGEYNSSTMDQFATNPSSQTTGLFDFISETPTGHEETDATACPNYYASVPFWGWGSESCTYAGDYFNPELNEWFPYYDRCQSHYIFWIRNRTDCYYAYGCDGPPAHPVSNSQ